jgi:hypothetical protein
MGASRATIAKEMGENALPGSIDKEIDAVRKLWSLLDARTAAARPPEIGVAIALREQSLITLYAKIVGVSAWNMSDAESRAVRDGRRPDAFERWALDPNWFTRALADAPRWSLTR